MSREKQEFARLIAPEPPKGPVGIVLGRLSFRTILREVGEELRHKATHGAHELAAALWTGSAFVMYPKADRENQTNTPAVTPPEQQRGGREA